MSLKVVLGCEVYFLPFLETGIRLEVDCYAGNKSGGACFCLGRTLAGVRMADDSFENAPFTDITHFSVHLTYERHDSVIANTAESR